MTKKIAVGGEDFITLRKADSYYVDKTELLYELVEKSNNSVTLFTRPRRFGKTLTMSMIESFFSIFKKDSREVFNGLDVMKYKTFCNEYMNQYPVLFVSFKDVEGLNFESAFEKLKIVLADLCKKFAFLVENSNIDHSDTAIFERIRYNTSKSEEIQNFLKTLMRMMNAVYNKPVILLIDEYDVPLAKAHSNNYYREMLDLIRGIMSTSLKTNEYLKFAVVTGCLRIPKESIFTGVNNFASYSVIDSRFSKYFGFTNDEVLGMLNKFNFADKADIIKSWYDGYKFGNVDVYCPWDVVSFVSDLLYDQSIEPKNYWENTSGNSAIKAFFDMPDIDISDKFEALLNGETICEKVTNSLTYDQVYKSESNLWSLLLMTGYLTVNHRVDNDKHPVELRIPNREIANIFQTAVVENFNQTVDKTEINSLMNALWNGDTDTASEILSDLLWHTISYMDYHEDYYHAFLCGLFVGRGGYMVYSNKERGLGRPDIDLRDKKNRRVIIIEAKKSEREEDMPSDCEKAIKQIIDNQYAAKLDGYRQILHYGIAFYKKSALVKKM
ncbi:MAG: AAA family ATPase [Acutalibacteraceae bacterium]|nr:AAA family ATPase [Acutalibacteraceae bacterium]